VSGDSWSLIAIAVVALLVTAVAAMVEASAGLISRKYFREATTGPARERSVQALLEPRRSFVSALHLVQAIGIALAASLITYVVMGDGRRGAVALAVLAISIVVLVLGQAVPRALARTRPETTAGVLLSVARVLVAAVRPLSAFADGVADLLTRLLGGEQPESLAAGPEEEFVLIARDDNEDGIIEPEERKMIDNVLHLEETTVREIMVPRVDIVAVNEDAEPQEIVDTITAHGHSRLPVYRESIDQIVGILYAKDLLPFVIGATRTLPLKKLLRPAYVVPETKRVDDLLAELRRGRVHIAIVADEYGGTAGLVTIEDILEEIVGEIHDEYDEETVLLEQISASEVIVDGRLPIEAVEQALGIALPGAEEAYGTVAGFVHWHLDRLPQPGDQFDADGLHVEILEMDGHRLRRLRLTTLDDTAAPTAAGEQTTAPLQANP
jgi:CBS domain containing-hemolysin-like protein